MALRTQHTWQEIGDGRLAAQTDDVESVPEQTRLSAGLDMAICMSSGLILHTKPAEAGVAQALLQVVRLCASPLYPCLPCATLVREPTSMTIIEPSTCMEIFLAAVGRTSTAISPSGSEADDTSTLFGIPITPLHHVSLTPEPERARLTEKVEISNPMSPPDSPTNQDSTSKSISQ